MAGLEGYESVYRGHPAKSWEIGTSYSSQKYHGREVIRPLDIPVIHPLAEDNLPVVDDGELYRSFTTQQVITINDIL